MSVADELADVIRIDRRAELALDLDEERRDRRNQNADRPCFNCGGSGVRCCEFGSDSVAADERRAVHVLYDVNRTGNVTPAPVDPPDLAA